MVANFFAISWSTRYRTAVVAAAPASLHPANDMTKIGLRKAGRLSKLKASMIFTMYHIHARSLQSKNATTTQKITEDKTLDLPVGVSCPVCYIDPCRYKVKNDALLDSQGRSCTRRVELRSRRLELFAV